MRKILAAGALALSLTTFAGAADAAVNVLYRNDYNIGTDYMAQALGGSAFNVTNIGGGNLSGVDLANYDVVVYASQGYDPSGSDIGALNSYITGGGKLIFTNWTSAQPDLGGAYGGDIYATQLNLGSVFGGGTLAINNTGWGVYAQTLNATTGTVAATYGNGDAAIIIGNGGRTIWNGFLTDTVADSGLYTNQLNYVTSGVSAVPEPATWAMMIIGFGLAGSALRSRRTLALAA